PDTFTWMVNDGMFDSNVAAVSITVTSVNDAPLAAADAATTAEDTPLTAGSVLANDSDSHGGAPGENNTPLTAELVSGPTHAAAFTLNADGTFSYAPAADYNGSDSFTYQVRDALGAASTPVTVQLAITAVNDAPVAQSGTLT